MTTTLKPETADQVREAVQWAGGNETPLEVVGSGSKRAFGRPTDLAYTLELRALTGISLYEPEELVLSAAAGTPLAEIERALAGANQQLDFEPPDFRRLLGIDDGGGRGGTLGGAIACNFSGPRRIKAGAARDHFLGFKAISGRGEDFKSGGRVVKNVTGYDLSKLMAGSWGTLGVMTEVTVKVLPAAEKTRTVLVMGADLTAAVEAMTVALRSPYDVSGAAHLPAGLTGTSEVSYVREAGGAVTAVRIEGPGPSVEYRCEVLRRELGRFGQTEELHGMNSSLFWAEVRDLIPFAGAGDRRIVWRISIPPQSAPAVVDRLAGRAGADTLLDWGGGLVWLAVEAADDAAFDEVRAVVAETGGHATLIRAAEEIRAAVPVFQPQADAVAALSRRIKAGLDPLGVLNPGRMYAGV
ncbi:MAG: glycolate oxidase subunit GlcE [Alphaproteobacteria bacterium]|jgi:glycolate oxidase FAD binding subunit|nr:glycolate oxidase subunit GlcE [Alphaproteobacteria bacterium]